MSARLTAFIFPCKRNNISFNTSRINKCIEANAITLNERKVASRRNNKNKKKKEGTQQTTTHTITRNLLSLYAIII